jgi:D-alanyl-lipoteichoic acid acyltransferase DltB (MBOAT superfamily)
MINFHTSLLFFIETLTAAVAYRLIAPKLSVTLRHGVLSALSLLFLAQLDAQPAFLAGGYAVAAAVLATALSRTGLRQSSWAGAAAVTAAVAILVAFKFRYDVGLLLGGGAWTAPGFAWLSGIEWLGLSYMTFRAIDLFIQVRRRPEIMPHPLAAVSFLLFFPAYVSGPVNRFPAFAEDVAKGPAPISTNELRDILARMAIGVIKVLFLAEILRVNSPIGLHSPAGVGAGALLLGLYCQFGYIYFDFSGYSDVAIASGRLFGVRLPENFNLPFLARNLQDFWNRWHISFAQWFRDYIYFVLLRWLRINVGRLSDLGANLCAIFVTFFLMGAWHGDGLNWLLYGVYHGAGMSALVAARRVTPPELSARLAESRVFTALSVFTTVTFVSVGLLLTHPISFAIDSFGVFYQK